MHKIDWIHEGEVSRGELTVPEPWPWTRVTITYWGTPFGWETVLVDEDGHDLLSLGVYETGERAMEALRKFRSKLDSGATGVAFKDDLGCATQVELAAKVTRFFGITSLVDEPMEPVE